MSQLQLLPLCRKVGWKPDLVQVCGTHVATIVTQVSTADHPI
jgi:hypothetical protein